MLRLRTQLIAAFVVLSVLPLTAIVAFGYYSSERSFRRAVERETSALAGQMDRRVDLIADAVGRDIERVGSLSVETLLADSGSAQISEQLRVVLGENAELLTIDVVPEAPIAPNWTQILPSGPDQHARSVDSSTAPLIAGAAPVPSVRSSVAVAPVPSVAPVPAIPPARPVPSVPSVPELPPEKAAAIERAMEQQAQAARLAIKARDQAIEQLRASLEERRAGAPVPGPDAIMKLHSREIATLLVKDGATIGKLRAQLRGDEVMRRIIRGSAAQEGDVAFAIDPEGKVFAASDEEKAKIESAGLDGIARGSGKATSDWVVASSSSGADAGVRFAIARPISESLREMRTAAARNFAFGLGLIGFALIGIVPLANHIARDIETVTAGAERIAQGDLETEVRIGSRNEIGKLAAAFNRMARDLRDNQAQLLVEERARREQAVEQRLLAAQYERTSVELEEARRFQLSLLPSAPPVHPTLDVAAFVQTATEVGGDYWDYLLGPDGTLTIVVGDATGHGARAGTMVTVVKSLFATFSHEDSLSDFLERTNRSIHRMGLERMAMALTLARFRSGAIEIAAAGMPPVLIHRAASGAVEDVMIEAPPLGTMAFKYGERTLSLSPGDTVLLMTDGFPELLDAAGEPLGYVAAEHEFATASHDTALHVLDHLSGAAETWTRGEPPTDDITFVAVKVG
ncbi:MAG: SpoIIE family protein phosphatase [Thermoanaerobaculia bacterium]